MQQEEVILRMVNHYDPDEIIDILGISTEDLVACLLPYFEENPEKIYRFSEFDFSLDEEYKDDV